MKNLTTDQKVIFGIAGATLLIFIVAAIFMTSGSSNQPSAGSGQAVDSKLLIHSNSHEMKAPGAKVTLVEFGDYQCPACGAAYPVVKQVLQDEKGKINFVFRNFPLQIHPNAVPAAEAAESAGAQGKYWEMHDLLYENQTQWADSSNPLSYFVQYGKQLGLDTNKITQAVQGNKYANIIGQDTSDGNALGVNATPTFYINGVQYTGNITAGDMEAQINQDEK